MAEQLFTGVRSDGDGKKVYLQAHTGRAEWLLPAEARIRNRTRDDKHYCWTETTDSRDVRRAVVPAKVPTGEERDRLEMAGKQKDAKLASKSSEATEVKPKKAEKAAKAEKVEKSAAAARPEWKGIGMCALLRYLGSKGIVGKRAGAIAGKCGFEAAGNTVAIQTGNGRNGKNVPELKGEARKELDALIKATPADADSTKPAKKDKKAEKPAKSGKKKTVKEVVEDDLEDELEEELSEDDLGDDDL